MLPELRAMMVLQDRDRRLLALAKDLERLGPEAERIKSKLAADEASLKKCHDTLVDCDLRLKRLELDAGTRRTTIQRLKTQQFETRKNEEYQALGHEILRYEKELDELETRELELMEEMDTHRAALKKAEQALQVSRERVDSELASIDEKRTRLEADRANVSSEREKLSADVPEDTLPLYERLLKTKAGLAVAPVEQGKCGGCHMKLITSTVVAVQSGRELTRCENCGRFLYLSE